MPFISLLTNSATNFGVTGNALRGVTAAGIYNFVSSPFTGGTPVPSTIKETNTGNNDQTFVFYVNGINSAGRMLYWTIKHITTSTADFYGDSGSFASNNWGNAGVTQLSPSYAHQYGEELGRFGIDMVGDSITEGPETFQVEIRESSITGQVVLTSSVITVTDTSKGISYEFGTRVNTGFNEGTFTWVPVITNLVSNGTVLYWTINTNLTASPSDFNQTQGTITIYNNYGEIGLYVLSDTTITEGTETFTISLRTGSHTGPVVLTSPVMTIIDDDMISSFEFQAIGGGAGGPTSQAGGGGGAGQFFQGRIYRNSAEVFKVFIGLSGIGRTTTNANSTILESGILVNGSFYEQWIAYYGGWGATYGSGGFPSSTLGSTGGGCYTPATQFLPDGRWPPGTLTNFASQTSSVWEGVVLANRGGAAWSNSYITSAGGGGGAGGPGSDGVNNNLAGTGGPGILDWTGAYVCYGGGGVAYAGGYPIYSTDTVYAPKTSSTYSGGAVPSAVLSTPHGLANTGGGGSWGGRGGSGKFILRYPSDYRALTLATGEYTTYISNGYRYYVWTGNGTFKIRPD